MFPEPTVRWRPYPSILDGMKAPPFVFNRGLWHGVLHLIVLECKPGIRSYGIEIRCDIYGAFEEMIYSISNHGDKSGSYDGGIYIKEAETSNWLTAFRELHPLHRNARQFLFVGGDFCYETVGPKEPIVRVRKPGGSLRLDASPRLMTITKRLDELAPFPRKPEPTPMSALGLGCVKTTLNRAGAHD